MNVATPLPKGNLARPLGRGDAGFARVNAALFFGGFATFALMYCVQPLMPLFAHDFALTPFASSLSLSVATGCLAPGLIVAGFISEIYGRKRIMVASLAAASIACTAASLAPNWTLFLVLRALTGLALSGLPAVAMAYLAEEIEPAALGLSMGLYISGSTLGGMGGRLAVAVLADHWSWRVAVAAVGAEGLAGAVFLAAALPRDG
jgi:YNFM family putative membrane transporter